MKKTLLLFGLAALIAACNSKTEVKTTETRTVNKDSIKTVITDMEKRFATTMESKNVDEMMAYYADDIISVDAGSEPVEGGAALKKALSEMTTRMPDKMKITMYTDDVVVSDDGSQVVENGRYVANDSTGTKIGSGRFMATFALRDGRYKCIREMMAEDKMNVKK